MPDHARGDITDPDQRTVLDDAIERGILKLKQVTDLASMALFAELQRSRIHQGASGLSGAGARTWVGIARG